MKPTIEKFIHVIGVLFLLSIMGFGCLEFAKDLSSGEKKRHYRDSVDLELKKAQIEYYKNHSL